MTTVTQPNQSISNVCYQQTLLGVETAPGPIVIVSSTAATLLFMSAWFNFRRMEKTFAYVV